MMLYTIAPNTPAQKPSTRKPCTHDPTSQKRRPLITRMKRPSVRIVTGSVSSTSTGRMRVLTRPRINAATSADTKSATCTKGSTYGRKKSAAALISQTITKRIVLRARERRAPIRCGLARMISPRGSIDIGLHRGIQGRVHRRRDPLLASHAHDRAREPRRFEPVARLEIMQHGRLHRVRQAVGELHLAFDVIVGERDALRASDGPGLANRRFEHAAHVLVGADHAYGLACRRGHAGQCHQKTELFPERALDV